MVRGQARGPEVETTSSSFFVASPTQPPIPEASPDSPQPPTTPKLPNELHDITRKSLPHLSPGTADLLRLLLDRAEADDEDEDEDDDEPRPIPDWATPEAEAEDERLLDEMSPVPRYKGPF